MMQSQKLPGLRDVGLSQIKLDFINQDDFRDKPQTSHVTMRSDTGKSSKFETENMIAGSYLRNDGNKDNKFTFGFISGDTESEASDGKNEK